MWYLQVENISLLLCTAEWNRAILWLNWRLRKFSSWEGSRPGKAAQDRGRVTIPGRVSWMCTCSTWGPGLVVGLAGPGAGLDVMISESFSSLNNSMILYWKWNNGKQSVDSDGSLVLLALQCPGSLSFLCSPARTWLTALTEKLNSSTGLWWGWHLSASRNF